MASQKTGEPKECDDEAVMVRKLKAKEAQLATQKRRSVTWSRTSFIFMFILRISVTKNVYQAPEKSSCSGKVSTIIPMHINNKTRIDFLFYMYVTLFLSTAMAANSTTMTSADEFVPTARLTTSKLTNSTPIRTASSSESKPIQEPSKIFRYIVKQFT